MGGHLLNPGAANTGLDIDSANRLGDSALYGPFLIDASVSSLKQYNQYQGRAKIMYHSKIAPSNLPSFTLDASNECAMNASKLPLTDQNECRHLIKGHE